MKVVNKEAKKLSQMNQASPEYTVTRNYLDWILDLPWTGKTEDNLDVRHAAGVLDACHELGITLIAYSPLAGGRLTGKYSAQNKASGFFRRILPQYNRKALDAIQPVIKLLREIGDRYSKTPSQIAIRWLIENPIVLPIPGAKNSKQANENAGALSFALTPEEVEALSQATLVWRK